MGNRYVVVVWGMYLWWRWFVIYGVGWCVCAWMVGWLCLLRGCSVLWWYVWESILIWDVDGIWYRLSVFVWLMGWLCIIMGAALLFHVDVYEAPREVRCRWRYVVECVYVLTWVRGWLYHLMGAVVLICVDCTRMVCESLREWSEMLMEYAVECVCIGIDGGWW